MEEVLRIGIIGAGTIASAHAEAIGHTPGLKLVGAARRNIDRWRICGVLQM